MKKVKHTDNELNIKSNRKKIPLKSSFFILLVVLGIVTSMFFSTKYIFNNSRFGNLYGDGIKVTVNLKNVKNDVAISKKELTEAENSIYTRATDLGYGRPSILVNEDNNNYSFTITQPNINTEDSASKYVTNLVSKSKLSFYTVANASLFDSAGYNPANKAGFFPDALNIVKPSSAKYAQERRGSRLLNTVSFNYRNSSSQIAYSKAITALAKGDASKGENRLVVWVGYKALLDIAQTPAYKKEWTKAGKNLYNFAHVYKNGKMTPELKTSPFNARDYLISDAPVNFVAPTSNAAVFINNSFQPEIAKSLAARINYGTSSYELSPIGRFSFVNAPFGKTAIHRVEISALIILTLIIILLIGRYGVLGLVSALAFGLFSTLTLLLFTVFQGQFTLLTIGAIIFGILLMLDYSVNTFERLKKELYEGKSINRAINAANKYSVPSLFDSSFVMLMISFVVFYIGATYLPGFSVIVVISLLLTIFLSFIFINVFTRILIKLNVFNKRTFLLGNYNSKKDKYLATQNKLEKVNYSKKSKWVLLGSATTIFAGIITFSVFAGIGGSLTNGVNSNINLSGGQQVWIRSIKQVPIFKENPLPQQFTQKEVNAIYSIEKKYDNEVISITSEYSTKEKTQVNGIIVIFKKDYNTAAFTNDLKTIVWEQGNVLNVQKSHFNSFVDKKIFGKILIALTVAFLAVVIYVLFRFRWTFSLALLVALLHDGLIITTVFIVLRLPFSSAFVGAIVVVMFYSIFNKILVFNRMRREIINTKIKSSTEFKTIMHKALGETLIRNVILFIIFFSISIITIAVPHATNITFGLTLIIGSIISSISIYLVFPWFWLKLEKIRFNGIKKHATNHLWDVDVEEEQTFPNINEIKEI